MKTEDNKHNHRMPALATLAAALATGIDASAQQTSLPATDTMGGSTRTIITIIAVISIAMTVNMLYILIRGGRYKYGYTAGYMMMKREKKIAKEKEKQARNEAGTKGNTTGSYTGTSETSGEEEIRTCREKLDKACEKLDIEKLVRPESLYYSNLTIGRIRNSSKRLKEVLQYCPTDSNIIEQINRCTTVVNKAEKRRFFGSVVLMAVTAVIAAAAYLLGFRTAAILMAAGLVVYFFASFTPYFLYEKRKRKGENDIFNGLLGNTFAAVIGARRYRQLFKKSGEQGETNSGTGIAQKILYAIIFIVLCIVFSLLIFVWAVFNYIRNYVLYF